MLPAVQWECNTAFRPRYGSTPYHAMFGRAPRTSFSVLANSSAVEWNCDVLDDDQTKRALKGVLELQEQFHVQVQERVAAERERRRKEFNGAGIAEFRSRRLCLVCPRASSGCDVQTDGDVDWSVAGGWCSPSASL